MVLAVAPIGDLKSLSLKWGRFDMMEVRCCELKLHPYLFFY